MPTLRTLLVLLLCLSVSTAGWASVGAIPTCAESGAHSAHAGAGTHHHPSDAQDGALAAHHHQSASAPGQHIALASAGHCKGSGCHHACPCGCGAGTCVPAFAPLLVAHPPLILLSSASVLAPLSQDVVSASPNPALLRPPIS